MNDSEKERLVILEQSQKEVQVQITQLRKALETNTRATLTIQRTLDELTGAKKFLLWITGVAASVGVMIATYLGIHHK